MQRLGYDGPGEYAASDRDRFLATVRKQLGQPYIWGAESHAEGGFDCSGLVVYALRELGYPVRRFTAAGFATLGEKIPLAEAQPGDFVFFGHSGKITHIAIVESYEGPMILHAYGASGDVTRSDLSTLIEPDGTPLKEYVTGVRRIFVGSSTIPIP